MRTRNSKGAEEMDVLVEKKDEPVVQEEATSTEPTMTMEDVERAKGLFNEGKRHFICGSSADAAKALAEACAIFGGYYGETARECADAFYYYGRTLLDLARKEPDVVANAVQGLPLENDGEKEENAEAGDASEAVEKEQNDDSETEEDVREKVWDAIDECSEALEQEAAKKESGTEAVGETSAAKEETPIIQEADEGEGTKDDEPEEADTAEDGDDAENDENAEPVAEEEAADAVSNLQLSWEMLDLARAILEKCDDEPSRQRLADCRLALGEQAIEDEEFDKAIAELRACIDLQKQIFTPDDRRIAVSYYNIGVTYNLGEKYEPAVDSFKTAVTILDLRQSNLQKQLDDMKDGNAEAVKEIQDEIKELVPLIEDIKTRIQDCIDSHAQADAKEALHELTAPQNGQNGASSGTAKDDNMPAATDVSHLVRKSVKHTTTDGADSETVTKKAKLDGEATNGENGHENGTGTAAGEEKAAA